MHKNKRGEIVIGKFKLKGILAVLSYLWLIAYDWKIGIPLVLIAYGRKKQYLKEKGLSTNTNGISSELVGECPACNGTGKDEQNSDGEGSWACSQCKGTGSLVVEKGLE